MAKGQKRGNREAKKPKREKPKLVQAAESFTAALTKRDALPRPQQGRK
jgi:hypothetical protein